MGQEETNGQDDLTELAQKGAARRQQDADRENESGDEAGGADRSDSPLEEAELTLRSLSGWGFFTTGWFGLIVGVIVPAALFVEVCVAVGFNINRVYNATPNATPLWKLVFPFGITAAWIVLLFIVRDPVTRAAMRWARLREERWLATMPFTVSGYLEPLGRPPAGGNLILRISFLGQIPSLDVLRDALTALALPVKVVTIEPEPSPGVVLLKLQFIFSAGLGRGGSYQPETPDTFRFFVPTFRRLCRDYFLMVHRASHLKSVTVDWSHSDWMD